MTYLPKNNEGAARFQAGQAVRIRSAQAYTHIRTPWYVMGKVGVIERVVGRFPDAEQTAYGHADARQVMLYRVRLSLRDVWDDPSLSEADTVDVEIYEGWLEMA